MLDLEAELKALGIESRGALYAFFNRTKSEFEGFLYTDKEIIAAVKAKQLKAEDDAAASARHGQASGGDEKEEPTGMAFPGHHLS